MKRWTPKRKYELVKMWIEGNTGMASALMRANDISIEEFQEMLARFDLMGIKGLSTRTRAP